MVRILKAIKHAKVAPSLALSAGMIHCTILWTPWILRPLDASIPEANVWMSTVRTIIDLDSATVAIAGKSLQVVFKGELQSWIVARIIAPGDIVENTLVV